MWLSMESKDTMPLETWYPPLARRPDMMHTYLVSVSMVWTCTLLWVWERTASCWAHFKQRPPTRLEAPAARRDSLCFNLSLRSSQVFWYSTKSFLKGRGKILGNVQGKVQCFQMKHQRELPPPSVVWTHGLTYPSLEHRGTAPLLYYVENAIREHYSGNTGSSPNFRFYLKSPSFCSICKWITSLYLRSVNWDSRRSLFASYVNFSLSCEWGKKAHFGNACFHKTI